MLDMRTILVTLIATSLVACAPTRELPDQVVISVIGTNDVHGELMPRADHGGIAVFSGYVANIREARSDDGDLLLVDAGDMWQGTLESNLNEGLSVVEAYNAMGYSAAAIGNHEFDFGPVGPRPIPRNEADNPRGALQAGASKAEFPLLAANLVDSSTGEVVEWDNVQSATLVEKAGVVIGIVGVLTEATPSTTIAANVRGLEIAPLAETIEKHATRLRQHGASLVIVVAHAGSRCAVFDDPFDTSSCDMDREIMRVGAGTAGRTRRSHRRRPRAPGNRPCCQRYCRHGCLLERPRVQPGRFHGRSSHGNGRRASHLSTAAHPGRERCTKVARSLRRAPLPQSSIGQRERPAEVKSQRLGAIVETALLHRDRPESPLGNLFTDAVLQMTDADIAIHNVWGGIRAEMPEGEVTYGDVYRMMPFDNRIAIIELSGADLRRVIARQAHNRDRAAGVFGYARFRQLRRARHGTANAA